jgi:hexosaminidase
MSYFFSVLVAILFVSPVIAQQNTSSAFPVQSLNIQWEAVQNDYQQNRSQSLNALTITNSSSVEFPGAGWKMYFNSARTVAHAAVSGNATFDLMNGDLFSLTPASGFPSLKPGASVRIEYIADEPVVNISDGPEGFYLVWDANPDKGFSTGSFTVHPFKPTYRGLITPEVVYNQNKLIRDIPMEQLTKVFPTPVGYQETDGFCTLTNSLRIVSDERFKTEKGVLVKLVDRILVF